MQKPSNDRLLDRASLQAEKIPASTPSINRWVKQGILPAPIKIGIKRYWYESEIDQFLKDSRVRIQPEVSAATK